jgi:hypothetical protein
VYFGTKKAIKVVADPIDDTTALEQALHSHALSQQLSINSIAQLPVMAQVLDNSSENGSEPEGLIFT